MTAPTHGVSTIFIPRIITDKKPRPSNLVYETAIPIFAALCFLSAAKIAAERGSPIAALALTSAGVFFYMRSLIGICNDCTR